jgi:hypothetical protein
MRGVPLFMLIVAIPALVALGHDFYLFYTHYGIENVQADVTQQIEDKGATSFFATLGWIWTHYWPDSYKAIVEQTEPDIWTHINKILSMKAFFGGLVFAGFFYALIGLLKIFRVGPFKDKKIFSFSTNRRKDEILGKKAGGKFQYKRK